MKGATLKDVAREADVSIASASRAINGLDNVAEEVRRRVLEAASKLRYVPHGGARSLVMARTNTIGVLLPDIYGEFFSEIIRGVDVAARARGLHLLVSGSHGDINEAVTAVRAMGGRVDGLLVMSPFVDSQDLAAVLPLNLPLVTIASRIGKVEQGSISIDNFGGGVKAVEHLIDQGCKTLAHISGPPSNFEAQERRRGFLEAAEKALPGVEHSVFEGDFTEESGYRGAKAFLAACAQSGEPMPEGIFVANDMMAVGCLLALREAGKAVPDEVALVGFDDIPIARFASPPLSTLRVGVFDLGRRGLELLVDAMERDHAEGELPESGEGVIVSPELVFRDSSRRRAPPA
ncbi:LacI family transcription regulator [Asticcacaulis sp. AC460]|uniref:LacI family DNA-binding transcriptional regulator n=1 Tax=Asticcacaulis sp. AC460 TaxID=1282360 RepID=UPI0003C3FDC3|nr:LacI family DNA-binding transcriptional regulator [Asticcacaulis sp. AC460]ESQ91083.1 LacI family transcription regulator [Asticcacaulis sp. AC460]